MIWPMDSLKRTGIIGIYLCGCMMFGIISLTDAGIETVVCHYYQLINKLGEGKSKK